MEQADPEHLPVARKDEDLIFNPGEACRTQSIGVNKLWVKPDFLADLRSFVFSSLREAGLSACTAVHYLIKIRFLHQ